MDDNTAKKNGGLRELILGGIGYVDIDLPVSGKVRIHPYISAAAMGAYENLADDPKAAFQAMFAMSREDKENAAPELTEDDADLVARIYGEKDGFLGQYAAARATSLPFDAFGQALKESELWRDRVNSQREFEAIIEKQARIMEGLTSFPHELQATIENLSRQFAILPKVTFPEFKTPDLSALVATRSIALQVTSVTA